MSTTATFQEELTTTYTIDDATREKFREQGYVKLKDVLSPDLLAHYEQAITNEVMRLYTERNETMPNSDSDTYARAFRQIMNIWLENETVKEFVMSRRLGQIAADLMGVDAVRLYHDQALYKMPHGGLTPWHADQYYWPLDTDHTCTVWIPFQPVSMDMGPLSFSVGSHQLELGRNLPISDESEALIQQQLKDADLPYDASPFDLGEVSYHYGWTMHNAGENVTDNPRKVMTMIYFADGTKLKEPQNDNQKADWEAWLPGAEIGELIDTPINPVIR